MRTVYVNPTQQQLNGLGSGDFFLFTSSHEWGPKVAGITVYEPADNRGYRHSRHFKTFKEAERTYMWTEVVR